MDEPCPEHKVQDLVFVLDSSRSISRSKWLLELQLVADMISKLNVSAYDTRVALVMFSTETEVRYTFGQPQSRSALLAELTAMEADYMDRSTALGDALKQTRKLVLVDARDGVDLSLVIISDGRAQDDYRLDAQSEALAALGAKVYAVAIGYDHRLDNLAIVTRSMARVFHVASWGLLDAQLVFDVTQTAACVRPCDGDFRAADVVLVLDASSSVGAASFEVVRQTALDMIAALDVGPEAVRVALVVYSVEALVVFDFAYSSYKPDLLAAVEGVAYAGGNTQTAEALAVVLEQLLEADDAGRRDAAETLVYVFTDGFSLDPQAELSVAASNLRTAGAEVFAVGQGAETDRQELELLASAPVAEHVFVGVEAFALLEASLCQAPGAPPSTPPPPSVCDQGVDAAGQPCECAEPHCERCVDEACVTCEPGYVLFDGECVGQCPPGLVPDQAGGCAPPCSLPGQDVLLVVDASASQGAAGFAAHLGLAEDLARALAATDSRLAVMIFADRPKLVLDFAPRELSAALDRLEHAMYMGGESRLAAALQAAHVVLTGNFGARGGVAKVLVISDFMSQDTRAAIAAAAAGLDLLAMPAGPEIDEALMDQVAAGRFDGDVSSVLARLCGGSGGGHDDDDAGCASGELELDGQCLAECPFGFEAAGSACRVAGCARAATADTVVVLDASASLGLAEFANLKAAAAALPLGARHRVAVVSFAAEAYLELDFSEDAAAVAAAVASVTNTVGATRLSAALRLARDCLFLGNAAQAKTLVVYTDGLFSESLADLLALGAELRGLGVTLVMVAHGVEVDYDQLQQLAAAVLEPADVAGLFAAAVCAPAATPGATDGPAPSTLPVMEQGGGSGAGSQAAGSAGGSSAGAVAGVLVGLLLVAVLAVVAYRFRARLASTTAQLVARAAPPQLTKRGSSRSLFAPGLLDAAGHGPRRRRRRRRRRPQVGHVRHWRRRQHHRRQRRRQHPPPLVWRGLQATERERHLSR